MQDNEAKILAYKYLGLCFHNLDMHEYGLKCFKKMLEVAWDNKDVRSELAGYDYIGMQYYYLGDVDKASYYHERMMKAICESSDSLLRKLRGNIESRVVTVGNEAYLNNLKEMLKRQYLKIYSEQDTLKKTRNFFSEATQKFFSIFQRSGGFTPIETRGVASAGLNTRRHSVEENLHYENIVGASPADLSFLDLPSPHVTNFAGTKQNAEKRKAPCRELIAYINKRRRVLIFGNLY